MEPSRGEGKESLPPLCKMLQMILHQIATHASYARDRISRGVPVGEQPNRDGRGAGEVRRAGDARHHFALLENQKRERQCRSAA